MFYKFFKIFDLSNDYFYGHLKKKKKKKKIYLFNYELFYKIILIINFVRIIFVLLHL